MIRSAARSARAGGTCFARERHVAGRSGSVGFFAVIIIIKPLILCIKFGEHQDQDLHLADGSMTYTWANHHADSRSQIDSLFIQLQLSPRLALQNEVRLGQAFVVVQLARPRKSRSRARYRESRGRRRTRVVPSHRGRGLRGRPRSRRLHNRAMRVSVRGGRLRWDGCRASGASWSVLRRLQYANNPHNLTDGQGGGYNTRTRFSGIQVEKKRLASHFFLGRRRSARLTSGDFRGATSTQV